MLAKIVSPWWTMPPRPSLPMSVINPDHLLEQAEKLIAPPAAGAPRQADIRRAISSAYYGAFHAIAAALADQFIGVVKKSATQYGLVYRSLDHRVLADLCVDLKKQTVPARYAKHVPVNGFSANFKSVLTAVKDLQERRHSADYDPMVKFHVADAQLAVSTARSAILRLQAASDEERLAILSLLLFQPH
jgi:hypothetical protein